MKVRIILLLPFLLILSACYYKPFIGYRFNRSGFKNFSEEERLAGDNANPDRNYKVNRYDWDVEVYPEEKSISGKMDIHFTTRSSRRRFLFDLYKKMEITSFQSSFGNPQIKREGDLFYLVFEKDVPTQTRVKFTIFYEGKPVNIAGEGPIQWKKDDEGRPWISTITEGIGTKFIMPNNALLKQEADSVTIDVTVPDDLVAVANGRLLIVKENKPEQTKTYKYQITNPINTYNISFNIGHFTEITKPYTDITGKERTLRFRVLDYNEEIASEFYEQTATILEVYENLYGEFPFWEDGCKLIESTFAAMEHQSGIAIGSNYNNDWKDYNSTLVHELAHEWWGNSVTGEDYCDMWIHEGLATYSEALFLEKAYSKEIYDRRIEAGTYVVSNTIPVLKECDVLYNSFVNDRDQDIYNKGALLMHSLRVVVDNDSLFFASLKTIQKDFAKQNISTAGLVTTFNELLNSDYTDLFNWYLKRNQPPVLEVFVDKKTQKLHYKWKEEVPFYKNGEISFNTADGEQTIRPTTTYQSIALKSVEEPDFLVAPSIYYIKETTKK